MNDPIIDLRDAAQAPVAEVGGKGAQLGLLHRLGLPVPEGFVLAASGLAAGRSESLARLLADEIARRGWQQTPLAVRSSAPQEDSGRASFAGIYESRLNVVGAGALAAAIDAGWRLCIPSGRLFTAPAKRDRRSEHGHRAHADAAGQGPPASLSLATRRAGATT